MEVSRTACGPRGLRSATLHLLALCILIAVIPSVGVATMSTSSSFSVTPHGAASYTVPIRVAPGIAAVEPKLALSYTSGSGNGPFGAGWTLSGTSAVTRCPRNFAIDGVRGATVNFDANDRFCLDGQRLVPADGNNSPYFSPGREYRTEIESFSRVIANGSAGLSGPASFTVFTKSGDIIHYGHTPDSQIDGAGAFTPMIWAMNRVQDRRGNFMTFSYLETAGVLEFYLQRVDYTGNATVGQAATQSVLFDFDTNRSDKAIGFGPRGTQLRGDRRITNIRVLANGNLVRRYTPTYGQSGVIPAGRMRMLSLQECSPATLGSATEHCLPPHSFNWPDGSATPCKFNPTNGTCDAPTAAGSPVGGWHTSIRDLIMDVNGDGRSDMVRIWLNGANFHAHVALSEGSRFGASPVSNDSVGRQFHVGEVVSGDVNGDGLADLVNGDGTWISNGTRFTRTGNGLVLGDKSILTDLNGDGRADALIMAAQDNWWGDNPSVTRVLQWAYANNAGTGFLPVNSLEIFNSATAGFEKVPGKHFFKDVNGDGRTDVVYFEWNCTSRGGDAGTCTAGEFLARVFLSNGTGFSELPTTSVAYVDQSLNPGFSEVVTDVNGDGKSDLVLMQYEGTQTVIRTLLSNGTTFVNGIESRFVGTHGSDRFDVPFDGNADGRGDIARIFNRGGTASVEIYYSNGTGYTKAPFFDVGGWSNTDIRNYVADVNGDGRVDIVRLQNVGGTAHAHIWGHTGHLPDLISTFDNGLGSNIVVNYQTLAMPGVYTRGAAASYPFMIVQGPMPVVRQIDMDSGNGGRTRVDYSYERLLVDHDGRGSLGFARVSQLADAPVGRIWSRTNYSQKYPFIGMTTSSERQINSGPLIGRSTNTLDQRLIDSRRPFPYVRQVLEEGWDLGGLPLPSTTTTTTYDDWGNATTVAVSTSDGFSRTTTNEYRPADVSNWILGRLHRATVSATSPPNPIETPSLPSFTVGVGSATLSNVSNNLGTLSVSTTVTPSGGVAPITYNWSRISGSGINASQASGSNLVQFSRNFTVRESVTNTFRVTARDAAGRATTRDVTVTLRVNAFPTVTIAAPATNTVISAPAAFVLSATASDTDGTITRVEFFNGTTLIGTASSSPFTVSWTNVPGGTYTVTARAVDNNDAVTTSAPITLISNVLPAVSLSAPLNNATFTAPARIVLSATATDTDGISWVEFLSGTTVLNQDTSPPYQFEWTNVPRGVYSLTARARDSRGGVVASSPVSVSVGNALPTVSITTPASGTVVNAPSNISFSAAAADADGTIKQVEYFNGAVSIGTSTVAPYAVTWVNPPLGTYSVTAEATDDLGGKRRSNAVEVVVNARPTVQISAPASGSVFSAPASIGVLANASDADGSISSVEFLSNGAVIGTSSTAPYSFVWPNVGPGSYTLSARAYDNRGVSTTSSGVAVIVNALPSVAISAPVNGASFISPASITLNATASDADGTINRVEYFNGGTPIGSATTPPFAFTWPGVGPGNYTLSARAVDDRGGVSPLASIGILVQPPNTLPSVGMTSPAPGSVFTAPASVALSANASDPDGSITRVEFLNHGSPIATVTSPPFSFTWGNLAAGAYSVSARATDNRGGQATSAAVNFSVVPPLTVSISPGSVMMPTTSPTPDGSYSYASATASAGGGVGPYRYSWTRIASFPSSSDGAQIEPATSDRQTIDFVVLLACPTISATYRVTATDAQGRTAIADIGVTKPNTCGPDGGN